MTRGFADSNLIGAADPAVWSSARILRFGRTENRKDKKGVKQLKLIPLLISNMQVNVAKNINRTQSLKHIQKLSKELGTKISDDGTVEIIR